MLKCSLHETVVETAKKKKKKWAHPAKFAVDFGLYAL